MADPLSATASAITVIALCTQCMKQLRSLICSLRDVPNELVALSNEISDLELILEEVKDTSESIEKNPAGNLRSANLISEQLEKAKSTMNELDELTKKFAKVRPGKMQMERFAWLSKGTDVKVLQKKLQKVKSNLSTLLATNTL